MPYQTASNALHPFPTYTVKKNVYDIEFIGINLMNQLRVDALTLKKKKN